MKKTTRSRMEEERRYSAISEDHWNLKVEIWDVNGPLNAGFLYHHPYVCCTSSLARLFNELPPAFTLQKLVLEARRSSELSVPRSGRARCALSPRGLTASAPSSLRILDLRTIMKASASVLRTEPIRSKGSAAASLHACPHVIFLCFRHLVACCWA